MKTWRLFLLALSVAAIILLAAGLLTAARAAGSRALPAGVAAYPGPDETPTVVSHLPLLTYHYPATSVLTGTVLINQGACCTGGRQGEVITLTVAYSVSVALDPLPELRRVARLAGGCATPAELDQLAWQPFTLSETIPVEINFINWVGYYVTVQYRAVGGLVSPPICDDISVEGMPAGRSAP